MQKGIFYVLSSGFFFLGIFFSLTNTNITGAFIGHHPSDAGFSFLAVLCFSMSVLLFLGERFVTNNKAKRDYLKKTLEGEVNLSKLPYYKSVDEGLKKSTELEPFVAPTSESDYSLFSYTNEGDDAREISHSLVGGKSIYSIPALVEEYGKKAYSTDRKKLEQIAQEEIAKGRGDRLRIERTGRIGYGETDTDMGRYWEREAHDDSPHPEQGIFNKHWNVEYKKKGRNLHLLYYN